MVGRLWSAALQLDDARISEAHAMVSLRERSLKLIALRGAFAVDGRPVSEATLRSGLVLQLARGLQLDVVEVHLPDGVLGLVGGGLARQALPGVCSLVDDQGLRIEKGYRDGASAWLWDTGNGWRIQQQGQASMALAPGDTVQVGAHRCDVVLLSLAAAGESPTRQVGGVGAPLRLVANYDTVHLHREGQPAVILSGILARLVSEMVALDGPVGWSVLAGQLWPREPDLDVLRPRFDVTLSRLRRRLRQDQLRTDLVRSDGAGCVELVLYPHDVVEDRT